MSPQRLLGLWVDGKGTAHIAWKDPDGRIVEVSERFQPFAWGAEATAPAGVKVNRLGGEGVLPYLWEFEESALFAACMRDRSLGLEAVRPLENQWLLRQHARQFAGLTFAELRRCQLEVTVGAESRPETDSGERRIHSIDLALIEGEHRQRRRLVLEEASDAAERNLLKAFSETLREWNPDVLEGHGIFNESLASLQQRARSLRVKRDWGRFGAEISCRKSRLRIAERWIDYLRADLPGRTVFDTALAVQLFDVSTRDMSGYSLEEAAEYFGLPPLDREQPETILNAIEGIASRLLPTYVAQAQGYPMVLQEVCLRGTAAKVDLLLLERYYQERHSLPAGSEVASFAGGFTRSYGDGVFRQVLHFDVASLYPSLLLKMGRNPATDTLGAFIPTLQSLRSYRLEYKKRAREETDPHLQQEYQARQTSFKILINSFYGYLGFSGARFADGELASEVTRQGRELLQRLVEWFESSGHTVIEADTDGIYVQAPDYFDQPEELLVEASAVLPAGIDLEYDGRFPAMFCYKAKNYALFDGDHITVRGSALRSRGMEPFLKELTDQLIAYLLGVKTDSPEILLNHLAEQIGSGDFGVERLAKSEYLSMHPEVYAEKIAKGGKPRRAALEVSLRMDPRPRMGERVPYYISSAEGARGPDWQRAVPLKAFDPLERPYDPKYYLKKLRDWDKKYRPFYE